jgi:hypothetical protein
MLRILSFKNFKDNVNESTGSKPLPEFPGDMDITSWEKMTPEELSIKAGNKIFRCSNRLSRAPDLSFFGSIVSDIEFQENNNLPFKTMATDGLKIYYDPTFVMKHTGPEIRWVIVHEILHITLRHFKRAKANHLIWNSAADIALNQLIPKGETITLQAPAGALGIKADGWLTEEMIRKFENKNAEAIYNYLLENGIQPPPEEGWNYGSVEAPGDVPDPDEGQAGGGGGAGASGGDDVARIGDYIKINGGGYGKIISIDDKTGEAEIKSMTKDEVKNEIEKETGKEVIKIIG